MKTNPEYKDAPYASMVIDDSGIRVERGFAMVPGKAIRFEFKGTSGRRAQNGRFQKDKVVLERVADYDPFAEHAVATQMLDVAVALATPAKKGGRPGE